MVLGTDGGLYLSWDAGRTWNHVENIVAGQFYAIAVDDAQPFYNVYGGLQDNQTWGGPSRTRNAFGPSNAEWFRMHGGDGFYAVPDPLDHDLVYAEMQQGGVVRYDAKHGTGEEHQARAETGRAAPLQLERADSSVAARREDGVPRGELSLQEHRSRRQLGDDQPRSHARASIATSCRCAARVPDSSSLGRNEGTAEFSNISTIDESPLRAGAARRRHGRRTDPGHARRRQDVDEDGERSPACPIRRS